MSGFLANLENSVTEEAPESEEAPEEEAPESEEAPEEESQEAAGEESEEETEEESQAAPGKLDEAAEYDLDGEKVTGAELKKGYLRQADYTKKTTGLAEREKSLRAELSARDESIEEFEGWIASLKDPETMYFELARHYPDTFAALKDKFIEEALEEQDMTPRELDAVRRARRMEIDERGRKKDEERSAAKSQKSERAQKTAELTKQYNTWMAETFKETGLDLSDEEHVELVRSRLLSKHKSERWSRDTFLEVSKSIAKTLGKAPPAAKEEKKPELPPVRSAGNKPPSQKTQERKKAPKPGKPTSTEDFFRDLRKSVGRV